MRDAAASDAAALVPLMAQLGYPATEHEVRARLLVLQARGDRALVAELDGTLVGLVTAHRTPVIHRDGDVGRITALVVDERARGAGVGRALVRAAEALLSDAGCRRIEVTSNKRRTDAHEFYARLGYAEGSAHFVRVVGE